MMDYGYYSPFHVIGTIITVVFWLIIIAIVIRLVRGSRKHGDWHWGDRNAINILRERYAKGEISKEEYEERKKILEAK